MTSTLPLCGTMCTNNVVHWFSIVPSLSVCLNRYLRWKEDIAAVIRAVRLIAIFKPGALVALQSYTCEALSTPLSPTFEGWK